MVFPNSEVYPADWSSIKQLFCEKYPALLATVDLLWQTATATPFNQIDKSITLEAFSNLPLQLRTAQQLRGLLYSIWRLNKDFTGTGFTSGGVPEMLMPNQPIASLNDACWIKLSV